MNFKQAIVAMAIYNKSDEAITAICAEVEPLCKTPTYNDENTDEHTQLWDWLSETGGYAEDDTAEDIAAEWDNLSA